ncbi:hypothetical protein Tco_0021574, partial [Tanacetum coccineum]
MMKQVKNVDGGQETTGEENNVEVVNHKAVETDATFKKGVGIEVENSKCERKARKGKLAALLEKVKKKLLEKVNESCGERGARGKGKKELKEDFYGKRKHDGLENGDIR